MISRSDDYVEYCRDIAKNARDLHDLAMRGRDKKEMTQIIHDHIVEAVELGPGDDLVDIGCGNGILLRMAQKLGVRSAVGLLATDEEVALVRREGLDVRQALTHELPLPDASATVVVCNSRCWWCLGRRFRRACGRFFALQNPARGFLLARFRLQNTGIRRRNSSRGESFWHSCIASMD